MPPESFGELLRTYRLEKRLSQEHLAELASLSSVAVSALERGFRRAPYPQTVVALSSALGLTEAQERRLERAAAGARRRPPRAPRPTATFVNNLPREATPLIGREAALAEVCRRIRSADERIISIVGAGGFGKTKLALHAAQGLEAEFRNDVWFVDLHAIVSDVENALDQIAVAIAAVLEIRERPDVDLLTTLASALRDRRILLLLDNCEHLIAGVSVLVTRLVRACPDLHILATSRAPLRVAGEYVFALGPLPEAEASRLLFARAEAAGYALPSTEATRSSIAHTVVRLDGNPLAIELAVIRLRTLSVAALADGLDDRFRLLSFGRRDAPARHRSLRGLMDWSYENLKPDEQMMLRTLSVFRGGCTVEAASEVFQRCSSSDGDPLDLISALVEQSLLTFRAEIDGRYDMLETIQRYAYEKLEAAGELDRATREHAEFFCQASRRTRGWEGLEETYQWFEQLKPDLPNFRAALTWSLEQAHDPILGARLLTGLLALFRFLSHIEGARWAELALRLLPSDAPPELCADLAVSFNFGMRSKRLARLEEALEVFRSLGLEDKQREALIALVGAYERNGLFDKMERAASESVAIARRLGSEQALATALTVQGSIWRDATERQAIMEEANALRPADPVFELYGRALAEVSRGNHEGARDHLRSAVRVLERYPSIFTDNRAILLLEVAWRSLSLDDLCAAYDAARDTLRLSVQTGYLEMIFESLHFLAVLAARIGENEIAGQLFGFAKPKLGPWGQNSASDVPLVDAALERLRRELSDEELEKLRKRGSRLSEEDAVTLALSLPRPPAECVH